MSPRELVKRIKSLKIEWIAITDHNSMANCDAYEKVALDAGLSFTWGVEIQTAEEVHLLAYFDDPDAARCFDRQLYQSLLPVHNDSAFFGDQAVIDADENILRFEEKALINSSVWDIETCFNEVSAYGGICYPAHVDAPANSILSQLGFVPEMPVFEMYGITAGLDVSSFIDLHPYFRGKALIRSSDAHYLDDLGSGVSHFYIDQPSCREMLLAARGEAERKIEGAYDPGALGFGVENSGSPPAEPNFGIPTK